MDRPLAQRRPIRLLVVGSVLAAAGIGIAIWLLLAGILAFLVVALVLLVVGFALIRGAFGRGLQPREHLHRR